MNRGERPRVFAAIAATGDKRKGGDDNPDGQWQKRGTNISPGLACEETGEAVFLGEVGRDSVMGKRPIWDAARTVASFSRR